jgi:ferritin-like metal-binding protein YciE
LGKIESWGVVYVIIDEKIDYKPLIRTMASITIQVDEDIKTAFEGATSETQKQLSHIVQLFLRGNLHNKTLTEVMAEISDKAQQRGLTPEILQEILADDNDE